MDNYDKQDQLHTSSSEPAQTIPRPGREPRG